MLRVDSRNSPMPGQWYHRAIWQSITIYPIKNKIFLTISYGCRPNAVSIAVMHSITKSSLQRKGLIRLAYPNHSWLKEHSSGAQTRAEAESTEACRLNVLLLRAFQPALLHSLGPPVQGRNYWVWVGPSRISP